MTSLEDLAKTVRADKCIMLSGNGNIETEVDNMKESIGEYFPSKFLKADDVKAETAVTISELKEEKVGEDTKPVIYFEEVDKGLVLNKTNSLKIAKVLGSDKPIDWPGKKVVLCTALVTYKSEEVPAIRVKEFIPAAGQPPAASFSPEEVYESMGEWMRT